MEADAIIGLLDAELARLRTILLAVADWLWHGLQSHSNMETYLRSQAGPATIEQHCRRCEDAGCPECEGAAEFAEEQLALDMLQAMRPDVPTAALRAFMAGTNGPYLHVDPDEFRSIARWVMTQKVRSIQPSPLQSRHNSDKRAT